MNTKTKKSPKQVVARISSLLKGIDNSAVVINKHKAIVADAVKEVRTLMGGLTNLSTEKLAPAPKPVKKTEKENKPAKPAKPAKKVEAKKAVKPAKKAVKPKKPAKKVEAKKPAKAKVEKEKNGDMKKPVDGRPLLKEAVKHVISSNAESMSAADIWNQATAKWGYWSRTSLYNVLKDEKAFRRHGDKFGLATNSVDDDEAEQFVRQVAATQVVSNVQ